MTRGARRSIVLAAVVVALWSAAHAVAMSSGGTMMHDQMSSTGGVVLTCMLIVGIAGAMAVGVRAPLVAFGAADRTDPCSRSPEWRRDMFETPARASPAWLQRFRR